MRATIRVLTVGLLCHVSSLNAATPNATADGTAPVRAVLDAQVSAWNRGDLASYMDGYWRSPELTFFSNSVITRGWQATFDRYRARYQGPSSEMGKLRFEGLELVPLGPDSTLARGTFVLALAAGERRGVFTVVFRRLPEGWRIVHDHSSI